MRVDRAAFEDALNAAAGRLLAARAPGGYWEGRLSSSALATATAVTALASVDRRAHARLITEGLAWLARNRNADGGWGDTVLSNSNLPTTLLAWSAFAAAGLLGGETGADARAHRPVVSAAESWLIGDVGSLQPDRLARALDDAYGKDRSFSVPILSMCALAGRLGPNRRAWRWVRPLPFELAALPRKWLRRLRLPVVSYALPALVATGQARHHHRPSANPLTRWLRRFARGRTLGVLERIQPPNGGFLEAVPLTAFVVMNLSAAGRPDHPVVARGVRFLIDSVRDDGSWPIDTNLATWVTTLAVNALGADGRIEDRLRPEQRRALREWLLAQQHRRLHPYTGAPPGGWAWTHLSGGVPDADDTAGALLALRRLGPADEPLRSAADDGARWLMDLQNADGGTPTFCRGWGRLPFDRSSPDLTAHAMRALLAWEADLSPGLRRRVPSALRRGVEYLRRTQREDGSWVPLWFGNQLAPDHANPTYGTARVLLALTALAGRARGDVSELIRRGRGWLASAQNPDGGWGGARSVPSSIEETAVAVEALAEVARTGAGLRGQVGLALLRGVNWLVRNTEGATRMHASPIGLYFARLWYFERLYPLVFTTAALGRARRLLQPTRRPTRRIETAAGRMIQADPSTTPCRAI